MSGADMLDAYQMQLAALKGDNRPEVAELRQLTPLSPCSPPLSLVLPQPPPQRHCWLQDSSLYFSRSAPFSPSSPPTAPGTTSAR